MSPEAEDLLPAAWTRCAWLLRQSLIRDVMMIVVFYFSLSFHLCSIDELQELAENCLI
jgi:hypothetical protein